VLAILLADLLDLVAGLVAGGLVIVVAVGGASVPRLLLAAAFLFFVPGRAIMTNWPRLAQWSEAAMSMVLSLAVLALVATVTLWAHDWHPLGWFQAEAGVSIVFLILGAYRRHARTDRPADGQAGS
jgi:uncharacterized membrane protein